MRAVRAAIGQAHGGRGDRRRRLLHHPTSPGGTANPIVVQLGKWRRMTYVDINNACVDNPVADPELTRLPRSRSDGKKASLPRIAIAAGAADGCSVCSCAWAWTPANYQSRRDRIRQCYNQPPALGSDPNGRYDPAVNSGAAFPDAAAFWSDINQLSKYDLVLLACAGNQSAADPTRTLPNPITDAAKASLVKYLSSGGRVLGEHYNSAWIRSFPPKPDSQSNGAVPSPVGTDVASWFPYVDAADPSARRSPRERLHRRWWIRPLRRAGTSRNGWWQPRPRRHWERFRWWATSSARPSTSWRRRPRPSAGSTSRPRRPIPPALPPTRTTSVSI